MRRPLEPMEKRSIVYTVDVRSIPGESFGRETFANRRALGRVVELADESDAYVVAVSARRTRSSRQATPIPTAADRG